MVEARVHICYLHYYAASSSRWENCINIFLAVTSSGSIAAWAIWREVTFLWPGLIAASQSITAIKPFLPFKERQRAVIALCDRYQTIFLRMERDWFRVSEGRLTSEEIHELASDYASEYVTAEQKLMKGQILPRRRGIMEKAEQDARQHFYTHFSTGDSDD
jgi:hypothetical protein